MEEEEEEEGKRALGLCFFLDLCACTPISLPPSLSLSLSHSLSLFFLYSFSSSVSPNLTFFPRASSLSPIPPSSSSPLGIRFLRLRPLSLRLSPQSIPISSFDRKEDLLKKSSPQHRLSPREGNSLRKKSTLPKRRDIPEKENASLSPPDGHPPRPPPRRIGLPPSGTRRPGTGPPVVLLPGRSQAAGPPGQLCPRLGGRPSEMGRRDTRPDSQGVFPPRRR